VKGSTGPEAHRQIPEKLLQKSGDGAAQMSKSRPSSIANTSTWWNTREWVGIHRIARRPLPGATIRTVRGVAPQGGDLNR